MGMLIENRPITCIYCNCTNIMGRENTYKDRLQRTIHECRWICPKCGMLVRCDERIEEDKNGSK